MRPCGVNGAFSSFAEFEMQQNLALFALFRRKIPGPPLQSPVPCEAESSRRPRTRTPAPGRESQLGFNATRIPALVGYVRKEVLRGLFCNRRVGICFNVRISCRFAPEGIVCLLLNGKSKQVTGSGHVYWIPPA
jgi:hypothetical protein